MHRTLCLALSVAALCGECWAELETKASASKVSHSKVAYWIRAPGKNKKVELVTNLRTACQKYGLKEKEMLKVAAGEEADFKGWLCGEVEPGEPEGETEEETETDAAEASTEEETAGDEVEEISTTSAEELPSKDAAEAEGPGDMKLQMVQMLAPMMVMSSLKQFDMKSPKFIQYARWCFYAYVLIHFILDQVTRMIITKRNDETPIETPPNPLAGLMGGMAAADTQKMTAKQYDLSQLDSFRTGVHINTAFILFLHFKQGMMQPLIYKTVTGVIELFTNPLFRIHLFKHKEVGELKRPFTKGSMLSGLFGAMKPPSPSTPAAPAEPSKAPPKCSKKAATTSSS